MKPGLLSAIAARSADALPDVLRIVRETGALEYTRTAARSQVDKARCCLSDLPDNAYRDALDSLAHFAISRLN